MLNSMGYKRFGCVGKDYEVGLLIFLPTAIHLLFFLLVQAEKNEGRKKDRNTFKLNFYSYVYNYFAEKNIFLEPVT